MTHETAHVHVTVDSMGDEERFNITNNIKAKNPLPDQIVKYLVDKWVKKEYNVQYKIIPIIYKDDKENQEAPPDRKGW